MLAAVFVLVAGPFEAEAVIDREVRKAEREAEREARRVEREARRVEREEAREARRLAREARRAEREADREDSDEISNSCDCSTRLRFSRPELVWRGDRLMFVPRIDLDIRSRGETSDPRFSAILDYEGETTLFSEDMRVSEGKGFAGKKAVVDGAICGSDYSFEGIRLGEVELFKMAGSLFSFIGELEGGLKMKASVEGCEYDEDYRQMEFSVEEFGNLSVGRWRRAR